MWLWITSEKWTYLKINVKDLPTLWTFLLITIFRGTKHPSFTLILRRIVDSKDCAKQTTSICCHYSLIWIVNIVSLGSSYGQNERLEWFAVNSLFSNDQRGKKCWTSLRERQMQSVEVLQTDCRKGINIDKLSKQLNHCDIKTLMQPSLVITEINIKLIYISKVPNRTWKVSE